MINNQELSIFAFLRILNYPNSPRSSVLLEHLPQTSLPHFRQWCRRRTSVNVARHNKQTVDSSSATQTGAASVAAAATAASRADWRARKRGDIATCSSLSETSSRGEPNKQKQYQHMFSWKQQLMYIFTETHTHKHIYKHTQKNTHTNTYTNKHTNTYKHTHTNTYTNTNTAKKSKPGGDDAFVVAAVAVGAEPDAVGVAGALDPPITGLSATSDAKSGSWASGSDESAERTWFSQRCLVAASGA